MSGLFASAKENLDDTPKEEARTTCFRTQPGLDTQKGLGGPGAFIGRADGMNAKQLLPTLNLHWVFINWQTLF